MRIAVATDRVNLEYTWIVAPMDGVVIAIVAEQGQPVVSAQAAPAILKLADLKTNTVKALKLNPGVPPTGTGEPSTLPAPGITDDVASALINLGYK